MAHTSPIARSARSWASLRCAPKHERLHEEDSLFAHLREGELCLVLVKGERLLAQDSFTRLRRLLGPLPMRGMGRRNIDHIDLGVGEYLIVRSERFSSVLGGKALRFFKGSRTCSLQRPGLANAKSLCELVGDGSGCQNAPTKIVRHVFLQITRRRVHNTRDGLSEGGDRLPRSTRLAADHVH